jgi:hypothetical protein
VIKIRGNKNSQHRVIDTYFFAYLGGVSPEGGLGGETLATDGTVEGSVFRTLELGVMVP